MALAWVAMIVRVIVYQGVDLFARMYPSISFFPRDFQTPKTTTNTRAAAITIQSIVLMA
jgi:hypothetical protein